jgi:putative membrane protein
MKLVVHLLVSTLAVLIAAYVIPGVVIFGFWNAIVLAIVLGIFNAILRPILIFFTLPLTILTFGLFTLVINTLLIMLAARIVPGFIVASFFQAFLFGIALFFINSFMFAILREKKPAEHE